MGWGKELADFLFTSGEYISEKKKRNKNISEPVPQAKRFVEDYYDSTGLTDVTREWGNKVITIIFEGSFVSVNINASHFPLQVWVQFIILSTLMCTLLYRKTPNH